MVNNRPQQPISFTIISMMHYGYPWLMVVNLNRLYNLNQMELGRIEEQVEMLQSVGFTLNVEERLRLKLAHANILAANENIDELRFWGRVEGLTKTYYIILGLTFRKAYEFPHKTFFYALSSDFEFKELPQLLLQHEGLSDKFNAMPFVGDPARVLVNVEGQGQQQEGQPPEEGSPEGKPEKTEDQDEQNKKVPKKNFTELARLAHVVRAIEHDSHCVPRGSYRMTPEHELRANRNFAGLDTNSARSQASWQHFRAPLTMPARIAMEDDNVVFNSGFLDTIDSDAPMGCWTVQVDAKQRNVSLRSLMWPGYYAFHRLNSPLTGSAYIGDGTKNVDLPFMI